MTQGSSAEAHEESQSRVIVDGEDDAFFVDFSVEEVDDFFEVSVAAVAAVVAVAAAAEEEKLELTSLVAPSGGGLPTWCERALEEECC